MKHPILIIIAGFIFLSSCLNALYLFPLSNVMRSHALRASTSDAPEAVPEYLREAENVIGYQFSLILFCLVCSLILLICLILKERKANVK